MLTHYPRVKRLKGRPREGPDDAVEEDHGDEGVAGAGANVALGSAWPAR